MRPLSLSPSPPPELLEQELRASALQKASRWRGKQGSPYNTTRMKLVFNSFFPILFALAKHHDPNDILNLRNVVLKPILKFEHCVAHHCFEVADTVKELWSLGVFHWKYCRAIVLGNAVAAPALFDMTRKRGRSKKKKGAHGGKKRRRALPLTSRRDTAVTRQVAGAGADEPSRTEPQVFQASLKGGSAETQTLHGGDPFNPSTINAHNEGDPDLTMVGLSVDQIVNNDTITECTGVEIFKAACSRDARDGMSAPSSSGTDATAISLEDVYASNPDSKLSNIDGKTLSSAGEAVKQVVLEATYGFLQKCIPVSDVQKVWDQILGRTDSGEEAVVACITVPIGTLDLKDGMRPISHLIGNCIKIISQGFSVVDQKSLKFAFNHGIALCDALSDGKRKKALENALHSLDWLMLGLDCKSMEVYRHANQELDRTNAKYSSMAEQGIFSTEGICNARDLEERNLLWSMKSSFEKFNEPFRVNFIQTLQKLLAAGVWKL